jgi:hypothetical protein
MMDKETRPRAGDFSICFECGNIAVFMADDLGLRELTSEERKVVMSDPLVRFTLSKWKEFRK